VVVDRRTWANCVDRRTWANCGFSRGSGARRTGGGAHGRRGRRMDDGVGGIEEAEQELLAALTRVEENKATDAENPPTWIGTGFQRKLGPSPRALAARCSTHRRWRPRQARAAPWTTTSVALRRPSRSSSQPSRQLKKIKHLTLRIRQLGLARGFNGNRHNAFDSARLRAPAYRERVEANTKAAEEA
jgi:hypothetical protein